MGWTKKFHSPVLRNYNPILTKNCRVLNEKMAGELSLSPFQGIPVLQKCF